MALVDGVGGGGGNLRRWRAAALGFGGLLLVRLAYVGCGGLLLSCRGESTRFAKYPVDLKKLHKMFTLYKIESGERPQFIL